jgi:predicted amidohydrolase YtcJ
MMRAILFRIILLTSLATPAFTQTADLAVIHARIYTANPKQPRASAVAIANGKILAVGEDVARYIKPSTRVVDAHDAALIPGFIDSHGHVRGLGDMLVQIDLRGLTSQNAVAEKVKQAAVGARPGEWILGRAWDQNLWPGKAFPDAAGISAVAPNNPVALERVDGHAVWVNHKALDLADINRGTPDPPGGRIVHDANGQPTGVLVDQAQALVRKKIPPSSTEQIERSLTRATQELARLGITTVHDAGVQYEDIAAYHSLVRRNQLPIRIYAMILYPLELPAKPEIGSFLTVRSLKIVSDGALGSRGAAMLEPYSDDPANRGLLIVDRAHIRDAAAKALAKGFQVNTHAIGDRANREALDAYADVLKGANDKRFRIEHAQVVAPADFGKFTRFSIVASMQPTHATSDMLWAQDRVGPTRIQGAYAWQTLIQKGVHIASGSDFPVENPNPLLGFYAAITRQKVDGTPAAGWFPAQRMSREEALRSWTLEGAYAAFEENSKGSLEPGKVADFVMLSGDIMTIPPAAIPGVQVTMTVVNGKIVYQR